MAGLIPKSFIHDLLERADIVEVVDSRVPLKKAGKNHRHVVLSITKNRHPSPSAKTSSFITALGAAPMVTLSTF